MLEMREQVQLPFIIEQVKQEKANQAHEALLEEEVEALRKQLANAKIQASSEAR